MELFRITGGRTLNGEYRVNGAKNSALPILAAAMAVPGVHKIMDCPYIEDVRLMADILESLGADVKYSHDFMTVDTRCAEGYEVSQEMMSRMRSSVFLLGSMLARTGEAVIYRPGGCRIGRRPIDIHIDGLRAMGFEVIISGEKIHCRGRSRGGTVTLPYPSVGATENLIMAALSSSEETVIRNCAAEPEIADLQGFLRCCGCHISGAGTGEICVKGSDTKLYNEAEYMIVEDRIEAATYMAAVLGTGGNCVFTNIRAELMRSVLSVFERMGASITAYGDMIELKSPRRLKSPGIVVTEVYPGFPTDCQQQLISLCTVSEGITTVREEIFEDRFTHKKELVKMGANIEICGKNAIIKGTDSLRGTSVAAQDLRGGAALVLAGLFAEGGTVVTGIEHIDRGYQEFEKGLSMLGGCIERRTTY